MPKWTSEQQYAIDVSGSNVIVSAGAGSGKTAVLTERVITKLKNGISLENLIILTFTNAAASEMKERIKQKIIDAINEGYELNRELDYIDQAIICTFDSYALYLVKKYSHILDIDKNISIGDKIVLDIELNRIIDQVFLDKYNLNDKNFIHLIEQYTVKDDSKLKRVISNFYKSLNNMYNKEEYLDNYIEVYYSNDYINSSLSDYIKLVNRHVDNIKHELNILNNSNIEQTNYVEKLNSYLSDLMAIKTYDGYYDYISNLENMPRLPKNSSQVLSSSKERIKKNLDSIRKLCKYESDKDIVSSIMSTKEYMICIIDILKQVNKFMMNYKVKNNIYEFIDIACLGIDLLKNNSDIRLSIRDSINEIMIDEYQDTNDIQDIFISLISNNNVYMVGDVKQSIYRFRNANPKLFMKKYNEYSKGENGIKIDLIKNFRSREEVLSNINNIFDFIMDEEIGGASYKKSHRLVFGNSIYNQYNSQDYNLDIYNYNADKHKKNEVEAFIIARDIKNKILNKYQVYDFKIGGLRNVEYSDFAILIDRSKQFDLYRKIFEYMNIPLYVHKNDSFIHSDEMYTILNLLKLVYSHTNKKYMYNTLNKSFISVARSFLFDYSDDDITNVIISGDIIKYIGNSNSKFYKIYKITKNISDNLDYMTLEDILLSLYNNFDVRSKISKLGNYNNIKIKLNYLLTKARELSNVGYSLIEFINYIDSVISDEDKDIEFRSSDNASNSVSIMTIHASKGLEFNICYFPEIYREFSRNDVQEQFLYSNKYGFVMPYFDNGIDNTIYLDLIKEEYKKDEISERLRLFYVALTRSKQKMIILVNDFDDETYDTGDMVSLDIRMEYKSFRSVFLSINDKLQTFKRDILDNTVDNNYKNIFISNIFKPKVNKKIIHEKLEINSNDVVEMSFSKKVLTLIDNETRKNMEYGTLVHKYLEIYDKSNRIVDKFDKELLKIGIDTNYSKMYHEYEFMYTDDGLVSHGIIDLLIEYNEKMYIIDYKLKNIDSLEYIKQLDGYKKYIENITKRETFCYLYSILDNNLKKIL